MTARDYSARLVPEGQGRRPFAERLAARVIKPHDGEAG